MCSSKLLPNSPQKTGTVSELRILLAQPLKACEGVVLARIRLQFTCISCNTQRVLSKTGEASREHQRLPEGSGHNHSVSGEAKRAAPCPQSCGTRDRWVLIAHYMALPLSPLNLAQRKLHAAGKIFLPVYSHTSGVAIYTNKSNKPITDFLSRDLSSIS